MQPVVFLDRDGTLIEEVNFLLKEEQIKIFPNTIAALKILRQAGFILIVVSNQSGVARGLLNEERVVELNKVVFSQMRMLGEMPDAFYYCPHYPQAEIEKYRVKCDCRKPNPGMIMQAQRQFELDLSRSYSIGDKLSDSGLAQNVGGKGVLVLTGYGRDERDKIDPENGNEPNFIAPDILTAAEWVANDLKTRI